jgi:hypothetical protein
MENPEETARELIDKINDETKFRTNQETKELYEILITDLENKMNELLDVMDREEFSL